MNIKKISPTDIDACTQVFMQAYNCLPWNYNWKPEDAKKYLSEYADSKQFVGFVVYEGELILGAILAHCKTWWTNEQLYIDELFITPAKQGKGYGKQLILHTQQYCKEQGIEMLTLMTNKYMPSYKVYNALNFIKAEQFTLMFKQL